MNNTHPKDIIYLIGARGSGKTTVGKPLANLLMYQFVDTDESVKQSCNMSIASLVKTAGWRAFRELETAQLKVASQPNHLISTGGGAILAAENRQFMRENGHVVYLKASAEVLAQRLSNAPNAEQRPSLTGKSIVEEMAEVLAIRDALYTECADIIVDAANDIDVILAQLHQHFAL